MTTILNCCGSSMGLVAEILDGEKLIKGYACAHCKRYAEQTDIPRLGWTIITKYASKQAKDAAEAAATKKAQALVDAPEPWSAPLPGRHACPVCDQMTGESVDELKDGWFTYICPCGASWQADGENTAPTAIEPSEA